jgi:hypothetical protein
MFPSVLRFFSRAACGLATLVVLSASCSRQPQGDRCDYQWAGPTQDCDSGLQCTPCGNLQNSVVDRCCPVDGSYSDARCAPAANPTQQTCSTHTVNTTGSGGTGTSSGSGGTLSSASGGTVSDTTGGSAGRGGSGGSGESTAGNGGEATAGGGG